MKKIFFVCIIFLIFLLTTPFFNFSLDKIRYEWPESKQWQIQSPSNFDHYQSIFDQEFTFLGQGNQSYVFMSHDQKYVIKFFKFGHLKPSIWLEWLPDFGFLYKYKLKKRKAQIDRLTRLYQGHWVAETYNRKNSAILYTHLHATENFINKKLTVKGPFHLNYIIDLDQTPFILQKKGTTTRSALSRFLKEKDKVKVYTLIDNLFTLYLNEYKKGVYDRDYNAIDNTGLQDGHAFRIDVGKLRFDLNYQNKEIYKRDIQEKLVRRLNKWVKRHYPLEYEWVEDYLNKKILVL